MNPTLTRRTLIAGAAAFATAGPATAQLTVQNPWPPEIDADAQAMTQAIHAMLIKESFSGGRIAVETIMTAAGALAGYAAQHAIRETVVAAGKLPLHGGKDQKAGAFIIVSTKDGQAYYFGDLLNSYLVPQPPGPFSPPATATLHSMTAAAVVRTGGTPISGEDIGAIFSHVSKTIGGPEFGRPAAAGHPRGERLPREELDRLWPKAVAIFQGRSDVTKGKTLAPGQWPFAIGIAAQRLILQTKDALAPAKSMRIVLEAAIPMSKINSAALASAGR